MWDRRYVCEVQRCLSKRGESELQRSAVVINQLGEKMFLIRNEAPKKKKSRTDNWKNWSLYSGGM